MNKSLFSNYLSPYYEEGLLPEVEKPSDVYDQLRIAYNQGSIGVLNTTRLIAPFTEDEENYDIIEEVWRNEDLLDWLQWVNRRITLCIGTVSYQTLGVRVRIAQNKLDKIDLSSNIAMKIRFYLCNNVIEENKLITNEDLPF